MVSNQCKYEFKANVDRVQKDKQISRREAIAVLADEIGLLEETARKMDQRARKELGQIVPKESNNETKPATCEPQKSSVTHPPTDRGGKREGAGRPQKVDMLKNIRSNRVVSDSFNKAFDQFLSEIKRAKENKWSTTSKEIATGYVDIFLNIINS